MNQRATVVGVFHDRKSANDAIEALKQAGFRDDQIGVVGRYSDDTAAGEANTAESGTHWEEGAVTGALTGAGLGALVGLGILAGIIPAVGPIIAGGTLGMMLANAAGGAAIAGLTGALVGAGIPEEEASYYETEFHSGRTIVTVKSEGRFDDANSILRRFGAYDMHTAGSATSGSSMTSGSSSAMGEACATSSTGSMAAGATGRRTADAGDTMKVHEEQLRVQKTPVQTGEVHVRKEVHTEHRTVDVPVQREEVVIERHPVSGQAASSGEIGRDQEIRIPVSEEQVHVTKQPVVTEEVSVGKRVVKGTEHVSGEVRKEQVKVEREGDVDVRGQSKSS